MPDPVPVRRAAIGCLTIALLVGGLMLLVRPTIFTLAPARDDGAVVVASASELGDVPVPREVILSRGRGWQGGIDAGDGRVQLTVLVSATPLGGVAVVNAASPTTASCVVEVAADRLTDCAGHSWTFEGLPLDGSDAALERFPAEVREGGVVADLTRTLDD